MKAFNINYNVSFRINQIGANILNEHFHKFDSENGWKYPKMYNSGDIVEMQMWEVISVFGEYMNTSTESPFYNCNVFFEGKDLKATKSIEDFEREFGD